MNQDILDKLNELIVEEKGTAVTINSLFIDSELDSLGIMLTLVSLESDYPFMDGFPADVDPVEQLDLATLTVRELVRKCKLSITGTSKAQSVETST